jgi:pyruvate kinase
VPVLFDVPGRKVRTLSLAHEPTFGQGDTVILTTDASADGRKKVPVSHSSLHLDLAAGHTVLADDGQLRFTVLDIRGPDIHCRAEGPGTLRSRKGITVPATSLHAPLVTDRDRGMLEFARERGIDFVGISFVEGPEHVDMIRDLLGGPTPRIVAKVEHQGAIDRLDEIARAADGIMIDRGDLSVETGLEGVALLQKQILAAARRAACPVIVATEMLHSMIASPYPTKAEVGDITNAVLDGASALMLSGETAIGAFPARSVQTMRRIIDHVSQHGLGVAETEHMRPPSVPNAMARAIGTLCAEAPVTKIVAITVSGFAARMTASRLPKQPILAVTNRPESARAFNLLPGVTGICVDLQFGRQTTDHIAACLRDLWRRGLVDDHDVVLVVAVGYPHSGNRMNLIQVHAVRDLCESLMWAKREEGTVTQRDAGRK